MGQFPLMQITGISPRDAHYCNEKIVGKIGRFRIDDGGEVPEEHSGEGWSGRFYFGNQSLYFYRVFVKPYVKPRAKAARKK